MDKGLDFIAFLIMLSYVGNLYGRGEYAGVILVGLLTLAFGIDKFVVGGGDGGGEA